MLQILLLSLLLYFPVVIFIVVCSCFCGCCCLRYYYCYYFGYILLFNDVFIALEMVFAAIIAEFGAFVFLVTFTIVVSIVAVFFC